MTNIDDKIISALEKEEAELFREYDSDQDFFQQLAGSFTGRNKWLIIMMDVVMFGAVVIMVFAGWKFLNSDEGVKDQLMYAVLFMCGGFAVSMFKQWHWMQINRNSTIREIKRVELQITSLAKRLGVTTGKDDR